MSSNRMYLRLYYISDALAGSGRSGVATELVKGLPSTHTDRQTDGDPDSLCVSERLQYLLQRN